MRKLPQFSALVWVFVLAACATVQPKLEPEIVRPVVVPERAGVDLVAAIELVKGGNLRQAEANLEEIVKVRPDIPEAHFNLGWVKQKLGKHDEAIQRFKDGLAIKADEIKALNLMGISQREAGQFADAEATYLRALALAPEYDKLHLNVGILYEIYLRKPQLALAHYRRYQALQSAPSTKVAGWIALLERQKDVQ